MSTFYSGGEFGFRQGRLNEEVLSDFLSHLFFFYCSCALWECSVNQSRKWHKIRAVNATCPNCQLLL